MQHSCCCILLTIWIFIISNQINCQLNVTFTNESDYDSLIDDFKINYNEQVKTSSDLIKLRQSLLWYYDKNSRPLRDSSKQIKVKISVSIVQINGLNEAYQVMLSTSQLSIKWVDEFLTWNQSSYSRSISFRSDEIWVPDILVDNNINNLRFDSKETKDTYLRTSTAFDLNERNKYPVLVRPDGHCVWLFPIKIMSSCQLDQQNFPFDKQYCNLNFRSSGYESSQLIIETYEDDDSDIFSDQYESEFDVLSAKGQLLFENISPTGFFNSSSYRVRVLIERKMVFYLNKIILPYFTFYVVTIFTYLLPVESGEKKSYSTSILISGMIYLKDTSYFVPKTKELPILSVYFNLNLIFIFLIVISSTIVYSIYYLEKTKRPLPASIKKLLIYSKLMHGINFDKIAQTELNLGVEINKRLEFQKQLNLNFDLVKNELNSINEELISIEKKLIQNQQQKDKMTCYSNITTPIETLDSDIYESQSDLIIGHNALSLIRSIKQVINDQSKQSDFKSEQKFLFCTGLNKQEIKIETKKPNFKLINTLESIKFTLQNKTKNKSKRFQTSHQNYCKHNIEQIETAEIYLNYLKDYNTQIKLYLNETKPQLIVPNEMTNIDKPKPVPSYVYEWKYLAIILDRIFFFTFALVIPICLFFMFIEI